MTRQRLKKARRARALSAEFDRIAEWRLAQARRRLDELLSKRAELLVFLGSGEACADIFAAMMMKHIDGLEKDIARARAEAAAASDVMLAERMRLRRAEAHAELASAEVDRTQDKMSALDAIEAFLQRAPQGPDKS